MMETEGTPRQTYYRWFMDKLLMGMSWQSYARSLISPFNIIAGAILFVGAYVLLIRYTQGLASVTHASSEYPWGLLLSWGLFGGVPLSATGFVMTAGFYIFGYRSYKPLVRLAVLGGLLGYIFAASYLLIDLGRPWRIYYPMIISFGPASILFLVAWHVSLYTIVQFLEFSPAILEWLRSKRVHKWAIGLTIAMTIGGIILSTLHQSALGALYLLAPGKVHPLWYSPHLPVFFLASSIYAATAFLICLSWLSITFLKKRCDEAFIKNLDKLTIGLGRATAIVMVVYFALKVIGVAHEENWYLLTTPYGHWFLVEMLGFILLPSTLLTIAVKNRSVSLVRFSALLSVIGVLLNRLNITMIVFNWNLPDHLKHIVPPWTEVAIVLFMVTLHILIFRWVLNRIPVLWQEKEYLQK